MKEKKPISIEHSALLIVDMSNDFVDPVLRAHNFCEDGYRLLPKMKVFIDKCRDMGVCIIYTTHTYRRNQADMSEAKKTDQRLLGVQHVEGTHGPKIHEIIAPQKGDLLLAKHYFSAFYGTEMNTLLRANGIDTVFVLGVTTDICCLATARAAQMDGYRTVMVEDMMAAVPSGDIGYGAYSADQCHRLAVNSLFSSGIDMIRSAEIENVFREEDIPCRG